MTARRVTFPAADGAPLRGRLRLPDGDARGVAVLCHPHPAFGGNMDVWLLPVLGEALAADGWSVLRFDFRSVDDGVVDPADGHRREREDVAAAVAAARAGTPGPPARLALAGWSFGALIALLHGLDDADVTDWVGVAPPTVPVDGLPMAPVPAARVPGWGARRTVVAGRHDQFFPPEAAGVLAPHALHVVEDADHFFFDRDREVARAVVEALR